MMRLITAIFLLFASSARAAITYDTSATQTAASTNTITQSITVGACANSYLAIGVGWDDINGSNLTISSVTVDGAAATSVGFAIRSLEVASGLYRKTGVASGSRTVVATLSGATNGVLYMGLRSYCGVDQTTPEGTAVTGTGSDQTPTVTITSATGEMVIDAVTIIGDAGTQVLTVGASQTQRYNFKTAATDAVHAGSDEAGAASVVMDWSAAFGHGWATVGVPLKPAAATTTRRIGPIVFQ